MIKIDICFIFPLYNPFPHGLEDFPLPRCCCFHGHKARFDYRPRPEQCQGTEREPPLSSPTRKVQAAGRTCGLPAEFHHQTTGCTCANPGTPGFLRLRLRLWETCIVHSTQPKAQGRNCRSCRRYEGKLRCIGCRISNEPANIFFHSIHLLTILSFIDTYKLIVGHHWHGTLLANFR